MVNDLEAESGEQVEISSLFNEDEHYLFLNNGLQYGKSHLLTVAKATMIFVGYYEYVGIQLRIREEKPWRYVDRMTDKGRWKPVIFIRTISPGVVEFASNDTEVYRIIDFVHDHQRLCSYWYGQFAERCGRCNRKLTDLRSRHYGVGRDCEEYWPDVIELVDARNGGKSWEELNGSSN